MRRRALLTTVATGAAGLAGCSSLTATDGDDGTGDGNDTDGETDSGSDPSGGDSGRAPPQDRASVVDLETVSRTYAFAPTSFRTDDDAEVVLQFDRTATAEAPARLTGWLENRSEWENTFDLEWIPGVGATHSRTLRGYDHTSRLHLAPTENNELAKEVPALARNEDGQWHVEDVGPWTNEHVRLDPGERVQLEYVVVGERGMSGRPPGTYEFRGEDETVRIAVWDSESPGPDVDSRFAGQEVPSIREETSIQWYHEADASTAATLRPATERLELDGAVDFELVYNARESTGCGHWNLHKLVDGEWFHVDPLAHTSDCRLISPGDRREWTLRAFNGPAVECDCGYSCGDGLTRGYLGGGTYAVVAGYGHPHDESGALLELVGEPVAIEPTDDATVERDGDEVTVTTDAHGDGEHPPDARLVVERAEDGTDDAGGDDGGSSDGDEASPERVLPEQVMGGQGGFNRSTALRNALAVYEDDVQRVVVRTDEYAVDDAVGHDESERRIRFRGTTYDLAADRPSD